MIPVKSNLILQIPDILPAVSGQTGLDGFHYLIERHDVLPVSIHEKRMPKHPLYIGTGKVSRIRKLCNCGTAPQMKLYQSNCYRVKVLSAEKMGFTSTDSQGKIIAEYHY